MNTVLFDPNEATNHYIEILAEVRYEGHTFRMLHDIVINPRHNVLDRRAACIVLENILRDAPEQYTRNDLLTLRMDVINMIGTPMDDRLKRALLIVAAVAGQQIESHRYVKEEIPN